MKKYIYLIFAALSALLLLSACQEEKEVVVKKPVLKVVSSDVIFGVEGGQGTIVVEADAAVSVTSERPWVQTSVSGNTITVTVSELNPSPQSRYSRLTITAGSDKTYVTVHQFGEVFDGMKMSDVTVANTGTTMRYAFKANMTVNVSADQPWVHCEMDEENEGILIVTVDKHEGFGTRFATVSFTAGTHSGSMKITQAPTYGPVEGWTFEDTDGYFDFPDQVDFITVTPPSNDKYYLFSVFSPDVMPSGDAAAWISEAANETSATILALLAQGEIQSVGEILVKGKQSGQFENLPSTAKGLVICFDDKGYPTGEYVLVDVAVPDRGPVKTLVDGWDIVHTGGTFEQPTQTDVFTVTPKAGYEDVKYIATVVKKENTPSVEDFAFTTFAMDTREEILAKVASGELPNFDAGLSTGTTTLTAENMAGDVYVVVVAFGDNQFYTGEYQFAEIALPDITPAYYKWLGEWSVPRGDGADTWIVTENVPMESFKVSGIAGFDADDYAVGAFVAIVPYDVATGEMVFKVYENLDVTWQDSTRGTMNALLSGQYTNVQGKTYYNSGIGNTICRAKLADDEQTAELTPRSVTSGGAPAFFYNIRWYGRYTSSSGSRSGVSWTGYETALPNTMTKK